MEEKRNSEKGKKERKKDTKRIDKLPHFSRQPNVKERKNNI